MNEAVQQALLATVTLEDFEQCFAEKMGVRLDNLGQLETGDNRVFAHWERLYKASLDNTPFAPINLSNGAKIHISPGLGAGKK